MTTIFLYHQIAEIAASRDSRGLAVPPAQFEQQMSLLHREGYRCLSLAEAARQGREHLRRPDKRFVLTFDDGYRDVFTAAWPILERLGFTATVFLVAGHVGGQSDWVGQNGLNAAPLMTWSEIRDLARWGWTFGCHSLTHPRLTLLDDSRLVRELQHSKSMIEDRLGVEVNLFSYPYGASDARVRRLVAGSGYVAACGVDRQPWGPFNLWRAQCVRTDSLRGFRRKARGWHYPLIWLREESRLGPLLRFTARTLRRGLHGLVSHGR